MEDLNNYMNNTSSINNVRERVQKFLDKKEEYVKLEKLAILSPIEMDDTNAVSLAYKAAVDRNNMAIDFIIDTKNEIFKIKLMKDALDRNTQLGLKQAKVLDNLINLLNDILNMFYDERSKLDRIVRFYEKSFTYYSNF